MVLDFADAQHTNFFEHPLGECRRQSLISRSCAFAPPAAFWTLARKKASLNMSNEPVNKTRALLRA
jgi:hypothetical protein